MFGSTLLAVSRRPHVRHLVTTAPVTRRLVDRFVAGDDLGSALAATTELAAKGLLVSLDHLGEDTLDAAQAAACRDAYIDLLDGLAARGLARSAEVSIKLSALGRALPRDGEAIARDNAAAICAAAARAGTTATVDMEDHTGVDLTLAVVTELRAEYPWLGAVLQSALRRTESDCADLARPGSRVRLVKGAYAEPASVAFSAKADVDESYVRCLGVLLAGPGYPMVATHDAAMIDAARALVAEYGRTPDDHEFQMLYGIRVAEQERIAASGSQMRVYLPYGADWYGYFMRRLAERPANLAFFARSLLSR